MYDSIKIIRHRIIFGLSNRAII